VALIDDATPPDWDALRCHSEWVAAFLTNFQNNLRDLLVVAGLAPPYTAKLAHNEIWFSTLGGGKVVPPDAALRTCRSRSDLENGYPRSVWNPALANISNWTEYPTEPVEPTGQQSYRTALAWPSDFVDGWTFTDNGPLANPRYTSSQANPLAKRNGTPVILSRDEWALRADAATNRGVVESGGFGNAVDVARALLDADPTVTFLDWDLDGDRGMGWPTWTWRDPSVPVDEVELEP
jgi:hypothetical protein